MENSLNSPLLSSNHFNWETRMVSTPSSKEQTEVFISNENEVTKTDESHISISDRNENDDHSKLRSENEWISETENSNTTTTFPFVQKKWNVLSELKRGATLRKKGRYGNPHFHQFNLSKDNSKLVWYSKNKTLNKSCVEIKEIKKIVFGEKSEKFGCVDCVMMKSRSFTVIYGEDKSLNLKAKSLNEMKMWVQALQLLHELSQKGVNLSNISKLEVEVDFRDRNRPQSSEFSGNFLRSHETKEHDVDPVLHRKLLNDLEKLKKTFRHAVQEAQSPLLQKSYEYGSVKEIVTDLKVRFQELEHELKHIRNTTIAEKDVLHMKIDLECLREKIDVVCNENKAKHEVNIHQELNNPYVEYYTISWNELFVVSS